MKQYLFSGIAILIAAIALGVAYTQPVPSSDALGGTTAFQKQSFVEGLYAGNGREVDIDRDGLATFSARFLKTSTGTSTAEFKSSSSTKGACFELNATSTNTTLNMTFAASSTGASTVGVIPVVRYGTCP